MTRDTNKFGVSIILCSHNRANHLEKTLESLRQLDVPDDWTAELILVDNASTDATPKVMRAFAHPQMQVRVKREDKKGLSNARNRGVDESQGQVLLFTDDDVRLPPNWIEQMATPILRGTADAVAGGVELAEEIREDWLTPRHRSLLASTDRIDPEHPGRLVGANMAIADEVFDDIPRFDAELGAGQLGAGEETLFSWQMQEAGYRIEAALDVVVEHYIDPARLSRPAWKEMADKSGRVGAYRSYHWEHRQYPFIALSAGWAFYRFRLWWEQTMKRIGDDSRVPMSTRELDLRRQLHRIRQHLRERGRSPKYEKHGFVKRASD